MSCQEYRNEYCSNICECKKCDLYKTEGPLLDIKKESGIMFVGLSAKKKTTASEVPLDNNTKSGSLVSQMVEIAKQHGLPSYRTNLVKCVPLDNNNKLRYPSKGEIDCCFSNLEQEIDRLRPKIVVLFGDIVQKTVENKKDFVFKSTINCSFSYVKTKEKDIDLLYIAAYHPSYVLRSKERTKLYLKNFEQLLEELFPNERKGI